MTPDERERMNSLCIRIQKEKNYARFVALLQELNGLIGHKERRLGLDPHLRAWQRTRPWTTLHGIVKRIIKPVHPAEPEKVEIAIAAAEDLFREIRIENALTDLDGSAVALKNGAQVDVTFEASANDTVKIKTKPAN